MVEWLMTQHLIQQNTSRFVICFPSTMVVSEGPCHKYYEPLTMGLQRTICTLCAVAKAFGLVSGFSSNDMIQNAVRPNSLERSMSSSEKETVCDMPEGVDFHDLISQKGSGKLIRSALLSNVDGDIVRLGDEMGQGTSLVIFLRHLA
jgi:hypothetical protein